MSNKSGFEKREGGTRDFVSIVSGKWAQRTTEDNTESVRRVIKKKDGSEKVVWELIYDTIAGFIQGIEVKEGTEFGDQLNINMENEGHKFTATLSMASREAKSFLCVLPNINLDEKVVLLPFNFLSKTDDRQVIGLNIYQGGREKENKVLPYFSKEEPNGLPQVPEGADKDEFKLVMKQQEIWLKKWVKKFIADNWTDKEPSQKMQPNPAAEKNAPATKNETAKGAKGKKDEKITERAPSETYGENDPLPF